MCVNKKRSKLIIKSLFYFICKIKKDYRGLIRRLLCFIEISVVVVIVVRRRQIQKFLLWSKTSTAWWVSGHDEEE